MQTGSVPTGSRDPMGNADTLTEATSPIGSGDAPDTGEQAPAAAPAPRASSARRDTYAGVEVLFRTDFVPFIFHPVFAVFLAASESATIARRIMSYQFLSSFRELRHRQT